MGFCGDIKRIFDIIFGIGQWKKVIKEAFHSVFLPVHIRLLFSEDSFIGFLIAYAYY